MGSEKIIKKGADEVENVFAENLLEKGAKFLDKGLNPEYIGQIKAVSEAVNEYNNDWNISY